jgi:3-phenylpropionate/trans-cinnamate dioxygenase ferredoxin subunit
LTSHILCASEELGDGEARRFDVDGHRIAVVRIGDSYHAVGDRCSHANYSLAEGQVWSEDCALECPKHYSKFNLLTGAPDTFPATQPVPVYETKIESGQLEVVI